MGLPYVVSIDFWKYKVEVKYAHNVLSWNYKFLCLTELFALKFCVAAGVFIY